MPRKGRLGSSPSPGVEKMKKAFLIPICIVALVVILLCLLEKEKKEEIEWRKIDDRWQEINKSCLNSNPLSYLCIRECIDLKKYEACEKLNYTERVTFRKKELVCAPWGCVFSTGEKCEIFCMLQK